ncbi:MAG TPA: hypothetical protein DHV62_09570 [Elusimicrobia bacterium]|jgi:hypothetical protein|nr:hypothetical protein [Elusimicrobiota bacterium]
MEDDAKYCGHCGMFLNKRSELLVHLATNFSWVWRRSWAGFASGFIGWIIVFVIMRIVGENINPIVKDLFGGMICGVFLGTVSGIIEESAYKAFLGGILGTLGGALGGVLNLPLKDIFQSSDFLSSLTIFATWAIGGTFIGATSGIIERNKKKIFAGVLFGLIGGGIGGFLGSVFYGSILIQFNPQGWLIKRLVEGASGGLVGAVLWFFIGIIEKLYIFHRREDPKLEKKVCASCGKQNQLKFWYCVSCGHPLPTAAPRQKMVLTPYRGMERVVNSFVFLSWLFGVTGVITIPVIFFVFLIQDVILAFIIAILLILSTYLLVVFFRFLADILTTLMRPPSLETKTGN